MDVRGGLVPITLDRGAPDPCRAQVFGLRVLTVVLLAILLSRLWLLQVVRGGLYERLAARNRVRLEPVEAPRGPIYDRRGQLLAGNRLSYRISLTNVGGQPAVASSEGLLAEVPTPGEQLRLVAGWLALPADRVSAIQAQLHDPQRPRLMPVTVVDDADVRALTAVQEHLWQVPSVLVRAVPTRRYLVGAQTAHALGYVGSISPNELKAQRSAESERLAQLSAELDEARRTYPNDRLGEVQSMAERYQIAERLHDQAARTVGKAGVEARYDQWLQGSPGIETWRVDARGRPQRLLSVTDGEVGGSLILNLDLRLQLAGAQALSGRRGAAVALDPRDGAVLALISAPSFDPNGFVPRIGQRDWDQLSTDPGHPLEDRAIRAALPPGSTFKGMVSTAAGVESGVIGATTTAYCAGGMRVGGHFKRCWAVHGTVGLETAIAKSCDVFFYRAGLAMGPEAIIDMSRRFGLGHPTGIDLPSERAGLLPDPEKHKARWQRDWYPGDTANIVIGQGDINTTPLQMAVVTAAVANGGTLWQPHLARAVKVNGQVVWSAEPHANGRVGASDKAWRWIRQGMVAAVERGTAGPAALPGVAVAGKTGSAESGAGRIAHAWFTCYAPAEAPTIAIAVLVEHGGHGSEAAAPVARAIMQAYFAKEARQP